MLNISQKAKPTRQMPYIEQPIQPFIAAETPDDGDISDDSRLSDPLPIVNPQLSQLYDQLNTFVTATKQQFNDVYARLAPLGHLAQFAQIAQTQGPGASTVQVQAMIQPLSTIQTQLQASVRKLALDIETLQRQLTEVDQASKRQAAQCKLYMDNRIKDELVDVTSTLATHHQLHTRNGCLSNVAGTVVALAMVAVVVAIAFYNVPSF